MTGQSGGHLAAKAAEAHGVFEPIPLHPYFAARIEDIVIARPGGGEALTRGFLELTVIS